MTTIGQALQGLAGTIEIWRGPVIVVLVGVIIGCLWLYASVVGED